jgi:inosine-uridine nucleoside N-ribohydrolase
MTRQKVLLDTDIGTDVDDAVALAYLLAHPDCDLLGITTVTGEAARRAELASALCLHAGKPNIPIVPGAQKPLIGKQGQAVAAQAAALPRWPHQAFKKASAFEAVAFLRETIHAHPGEVNLISIGPLTNMGLLFATDPEAASLLKSYTMMGGRYTPPGPNPSMEREWNTAADPYATAIVFNAHARRHRSVGLDVTEKVWMDAPVVREQFKSERLRPVLDFAEIWFLSVPGIMYHDPLAAATLFEPSLCGFERGAVEVDLTPGENLGNTAWTPGDERAPHEAALEVDPERFYEHYFSIVG